MSIIQPVMIKSDKLARSQVQQLHFYYRITGAKVTAPLALISYPVLIGYDSTDFTQTSVETFLNHSSSAAVGTIFDSVSLGVDSIGFVIDMFGQCDMVLGATVTVSQQAGGTPASTSLLIQATQGPLVSANTSAIAQYNGDIYGRIVAPNFDSTTSGAIILNVLFRSK